MNNKHYGCGYSTGAYDYYHEVIVFTTNDVRIAKDWVRKFNKIVKKWQEYYDQFCNDRMGFRWIKDEFVESPIYPRWHQLSEVNNATYQEIELRQRSEISKLK